MITEIEQETSDIDWFFTNGEHIGFVASGGGKLPNSVANKTMDEIVLLTTFFRELQATSATIIASDLQKIIIPGTNIKEYLADFAAMSQKGLFAFDKTVLNRFSDTNYHQVAKPSNPLKIQALPPEISKMLTLTKIEGDMNETLDIASIIS